MNIFMIVLACLIVCFELFILILFIILLRIRT